MGQYEKPELITYEELINLTGNNPSQIIIGD